jgi:hypothetical protein
MGSGPTGNPDLLGAQNTVEQPIAKKFLLASDTVKSLLITQYSEE